MKPPIAGHDAISREESAVHTWRVSQLRRLGADLHAHRGAIAALLAPWFSRRTVADLAAAFAGTSVPWGTCTTSPGPS